MHRRTPATTPSTRSCPAPGRRSGRPRSSGWPRVPDVRLPNPIADDLRSVIGPTGATRVGGYRGQVLGLTWLGHSTVMIEIGNARLLTDPLLHRHAPPLRRRWPRPDRKHWTGADAVLLSHLHHDHA